MKQQIAFRQYNPNKPNRYGLLLNSLDARFPYTYKALLYAAKPKAGDCPSYLKSTNEYMKYLVTEMKEQVSQVDPSRPIVSTQVLIQQIGF